MGELNHSRPKGLVGLAGLRVAWRGGPAFVLADRLGSLFAECHGYRELSACVLCSSTKDERNDDSEEEREELDDDDDHNDRSQYQ